MVLCSVLSCQSGDPKERDEEQTQPNRKETTNEACFNNRINGLQKKNLPINAKYTQINNSKREAGGRKDREGRRKQRWTENNGNSSSYKKNIEYWCLLHRQWSQVIYVWRTQCEEQDIVSLSTILRRVTVVTQTISWWCSLWLVRKKRVFN